MYHQLQHKIVFWPPMAVDYLARKNGRNPDIPGKIDSFRVDNIDVDSQEFRKIVVAVKIRFFEIRLHFQF